MFTIEIGACARPDGDQVMGQATAAKTHVFFVREDGGSSEQCSGLVDAPYTAGSHDCAWDHPFRALPPQGAPRIAGGDTLIIAAGEFMLGYGAPGSDACDPDGAFDCHMPPIPSGPDPEHPTRILGQGWDRGCPVAPELWGTQRPWFLLNLTGSSHVEIGCLELTDHASCVEDHSGGLACRRHAFPFGDWASIGIHAEDSEDVYLHDLDIHGLANTGIHAGRLSDWTLERVRVASNGWAGWDGDLWDEQGDANAGKLIFRDFTVEWNGCAETYPGGQPTGCWSQSAGGYGDGLGTGATGGDWLFENAIFRHNTSDGLDLLYHTLGGQIVLRRVYAEGNAGDQIKTAGSTLAENVVAVSHCGFFVDKPFTYFVDPCRAGGSALAFTLTSPAEPISVVNSTITGQGDCLVIAEGAGGVVKLSNDIFIGHHELNSDDVTCLAWSDKPAGRFEYSHVLISSAKALPTPCPPGSFCDVPPGVANPAIDAFDGHLLPTSPAIDAGDEAVCPPTDYLGGARQAGCDIGAYEFTSRSAWLYLPLALR